MKPKCPKCNGVLIAETDVTGPVARCLLCGWRKAKAYRTRRPSTAEKNTRTVVHNRRDHV